MKKWIGGLVLTGATLFTIVQFPRLTSAPSRETRIETRAEPKHEADKEQEATHAPEIMHERWRKRLDAKGQIQPNALYQAKLHADAMPEAVWYTPRGGIGIQDGGITGWEWLGPGNIGGRIRSIVFLNNTTILIGAASGGVWRSADLGANWEPLTDFMASLNVASLAADPTNTNVIYAGTGEGFSGSSRSKLGFIPGAGIFKSTNGGNSWAQLPNTVTWQYVFRLTHHPTQANTVLAATSSGLFRTTDGGANWTLLLNAGIWDVKYDPSNTARILAANSGSVFLSTNSGVNWTTLTTGAANQLPNTGARSELAIATNGTMYVSMNINTGTAMNPRRGAVYRSTNNGATWQQRGSFDYLGAQGDYDNTIWVAPDDSNHVIVGGIDLWRSIDGGASFVKISDWTRYHVGQSAHADQHAVVSPPNYGAANRNVYFGNDGGIQRANVNTVTQTSGWTNLANGLGITQFYGVAVSPNGSDILAGAQDNDTLRFRQATGANAWYQANTGDGGYCAYHITNANICYDEYVNLAISKSTNGGDTYAGATNGLTDAGTGNALFIAPFMVDPNAGNVLVAGGTSLWRTTNDAVSWGQTRAPQNLLSGAPGNSQCSALAIAPGNSNLIWAGYTDGRISRTNGSNVTLWSDVQANGATPPPNRWVTSIAINPKNSNEVFVTVGGNTTDTVWFTADNGANWENRNGTGGARLPAVQVNTITFHPDDPGTVYVGTDIGVFASDTKGRSWNRTPRYISAWENDGPANVEVSQLTWQIAGGGTFLVAATYGRGVYRTQPYRVIYVDKNNLGAQDGSRARPFRTVQQGINAATNGTLIVVRSNDYAEGYKQTGKRIRIVTENGATRVR
jgi:hypothetical protein